MTSVASGSGGSGGEGGEGSVQVSVAASGGQGGEDHGTAGVGGQDGTGGGGDGQGGVDGGKTYCDGVCTDLEIDAQNCGACGHFCGAYEACIDGKCCAVSL